jgi:hypothetical protein
MWISCDAIGCRNNADVDLEALARELGPDYRIADFVARSRCSKCGAKWPQLSVRVSPIQTGGMRGCPAALDRDRRASSPHA